MLLRPRKIEHRPLALLRQHYEVERELSDRLRNATREERRTLYRSVYNELYQRVPHHPQLTRKASAELTRDALIPQLRILRPYLRPEATVLEIGPGDCVLSVALAERVRQVYGLDVSDEITHDVSLPANFKLILSDGTSVPVPPNSVDVAYSNQLMEHLHPDDALEQLEGIWRAPTSGWSVHLHYPESPQWSTRRLPAFRLGRDGFSLEGVYGRGAERTVPEGRISQGSPVTRQARRLRARSGPAGGGRRGGAGAATAGSQVGARAHIAWPRVPGHSPPGHQVTQAGGSPASRLTARPSYIRPSIAHWRMLSKKAKYAIKALLALADGRRDEPVRISISPARSRSPRSFSSSFSLG